MQILSAPKAPDPAQSAAEAAQARPLPGQDGGAGTGEINPSNIGEFADKDREMTDYEKAAGYLAQMKERSSRGAKVLALLGIKDRQPGESEQKYIDKFSAKGVRI